MSEIYNASGRPVCCAHAKAKATAAMDYYYVGPLTYLTVGGPEEMEKERGNK